MQLVYLKVHCKQALTHYWIEGWCLGHSPVITPEIELVMSNSSAWMRVKWCLHTDVFHRVYVHIINLNWGDSVILGAPRDSKEKSAVTSLWLPSPTRYLWTVCIISKALLLARASFAPTSSSNRTFWYNLVDAQLVGVQKQGFYGVNLLSNEKLRF